MMVTVSDPTPAELRLDALTQQQDAELAAADQAVQQAVTQPLDVQFAELLAWALAAWMLLPDGEDSSARSRFITQLQLRMERISTAGLPSALRVHAVRSYSMGRTHGLVQAGQPWSPLSRFPSIPMDVQQRIENAEQHARDAIRAGVAMAGEIRAGERGLRDVETAVAKARQAITRSAATASYVVGRSSSAGVRTVADGLGASRLWIGERDACLQCLAYFGLIADPGENFPTGLTYGTRPLTWRVVDPPLHPHCRCRIVVWRHEWSGTGPDSYPEALRREARRSVARGWSLESESNTARLDAAGRLLERISGRGVANGGLPASVETYAEKAVRLGAFPRGRRFPV